MSAVPFGILGALVTNWLRGLENDVYFQIGLLVLIGLGAKNAVLRVSAAVEFRQQGKTIMEATVLAGEQRLRPIIMTSLAFAFGCLPLALALGAGANARHSIGTGIIGGMIGETTLAMLYVPLFFYIFDRLAERRKTSSRRLRRPHPYRPRRPLRRRATTNMRCALCTTFCMLLVAGCMMGPDYQRPTIDAPDAFRFAPKETADTANLEWWKQFDDPVLDALIAEALANNNNVKVAVANVEQAAGVFTQTRSQFFPQTSFGLSGGRVRTSEAGATPLLEQAIPNPQSAYQAVLNVTWEVDLWGRIRRLSESARANLLGTDDARRGVILSLVASVATDYLQLRGLDEQLAVAKRTLATYGESVRLFELQFKYGQVSQMNVAQTQSQYESAAVQTPQIESQIAQTENALSILLGRNPGPIARGKTIYELTLPPVPAGVPSQLLERRPDLMQSEEALIAANAQIGAAKALYFPTISLTGAFGSSSSDLSKLFTGPSRLWSYAGQAAGPIFTFGNVSGQVAQAKAAQQAALYSYQLSLQTAFADVDKALFANQSSRTSCWRSSASSMR
jgi:multidrug efflux system outer membrane protein